MKAAGGSPAGLVLATGQYSTAELYSFALAAPSSTTLYFTTWDAPLTVGGNTYLTNLIITRGGITQRTGVEVQSLDLELTPQTDGAAITLAGVPLLQACRLGYLDSCRVLMSKLFMATPGDVSAGAVPWFQGRVRDVDAGRFSARISLESDLALLNVAMPRNIVQTGCTHRLFDAGCTLVPASWQITGSVSTVGTDRTFITTGLTQANGWFDLGTLTWTSGVLAGLVCSVKSSLNASGRIEFMRQLPSAPAGGSTFTIRPGCDKRQATCTTKFSNLAHYRGYPYVPSPETMYAGGGSKREVTARKAGNSTSGRRRP